MAFTWTLRAPAHAFRIHGKGYAIATSAIVLLFAALQTVHILQQFNSPSTIEARASLAGLRTFDGHGWSDGYLRELPGSLLWPVVSGGAFKLWETEGSRFAALLLLVAGFVALLRTTRWLFGSAAAFFTAAALVLSAPFWILGHTGAVESLAVAAACFSLWSVVQLARNDHRGWLLLACATLSVAMLAQYRAVLMLIPASMLLAALRHQRAAIDIGLLWLICGLSIVVYFDIFAAQVVDALSPRRVFELSPEIGAFGPSIAPRPLVALWGGIPVLIGLITWQRTRVLRPVIAAFVFTPAVWIVLWLLSARADSDLVYFDLAFGAILLYPVIGLALSQIPHDRARLATLGIAAVGLALLSSHQTMAFDRAWPNSSEPVATLTGEMQPGDQVLANLRWPYALMLYASDRIDEPNDVLDETLLFDRDTVFDFCSFAWLVDAEPIAPWSPLVTTGIHACGTFEPVMVSDSRVSSLTSTMRTQNQTVETTVQRNTQPFQDAP